MECFRKMLQDSAPPRPLKFFNLRNKIPYPGTTLGSCHEKIRLSSVPKVLGRPSDAFSAPGFQPSACFPGREEGALPANQHSVGPSTRASFKGP